MSGLKRPESNTGYGGKDGRKGRSAKKVGGRAYSIGRYQQVNPSSLSLLG